MEGHISCYGEQRCCCLLSIYPVPGVGGSPCYVEHPVVHSPVLPKGEEFGILVLGCLDVLGRQRRKVLPFWKEWDPNANIWKDNLKNLRPELSFYLGLHSAVWGMGLFCFLCEVWSHLSPYLPHTAWAVCLWMKCFRCKMGEVELCLLCCRQLVRMPVTNTVFLHMTFSRKPTWLGGVEGFHTSCHEDDQDPSTSLWRSEEEGQGSTADGWSKWGPVQPRTTKDFFGAKT